MYFRCCVQTRALRVRCLGYEGGCQVEGPLSEVEKHETICPTVLIFCRFRDAGCSTPVLRKEVCFVSAAAVAIFDPAAYGGAVATAAVEALLLLLPVLQKSRMVLILRHISCRVQLPKIGALLWAGAFAAGVSS